MAERNLDFDRPIDRKGTKCLKYDFAVERGMPADILPLWVADMDFQTSSYIQDAIVETASHGIFGYSESDDAYFEALQGWMRRRHQFEIEKKWVVKTPGIVLALAMAVRAYTKCGDGVLLQSPVYYPFSEVIRDNGRRVISNDLVLGEDNRYHIDFVDFEDKIVRENIKLFLLCNPHNPVGRVWTEEELLHIGQICLRHGVTVVSDEIHHDFIFKGQHHVFAGLSDALADITVTCTSPSKTFNVAGLQASNIIIKNENLRKAFIHQLDAAGVSQIGLMGLVACQAAYAHGDEWYEGMLSYVRGNIDYVRSFVEERLPDIRMIDLEGTYLAWLDFRGTGLCQKELEDKVIYEAGLWLDSGAIFGKSGKGFERINVACPRSTVQEAMERIEKAFTK